MSAVTTLRIATRKSPLAMWQAEHIKARLEALHPGLVVELVTFTTQGDKILDVPLAKIGGKGLFVKELEVAMLDGRADIAVHSMKDVPMEFPEGLELGIICERENPHDAFVSNHYKTIDELPQGAVVGTSSLRRQCQIQQQRPDLVIKSLRGNVQTRLGKLDAGEFDAIILAAAGLLRMEMHDRIASFIPAEQSLPAGGQGALRRAVPRTSGCARCGALALGREVLLGSAAEQRLERAVARHHAQLPVHHDNAIVGGADDRVEERLALAKVVQRLVEGRGHPV